MTDRAVIFDMDGVLVDSYDAHSASWNRMSGRYGPSPQRVAGLLGIPRSEE